VTKKSFFTPELVREPPEDEHPGHGAREVRADGRADLRLREVQRVGVAEHARDRAHERDLEPVEKPGDAERDDDAPVPSTPRQTIEPRRDVLLDEPAHVHEDAPTRDPSHAAFARSRAVPTRVEPDLRCSRLRLSRKAELGLDEDTQDRRK
jgi:hypothetical protein